MFVRPAELTDYQERLSICAALWPEFPPEEHLTEMRDYTSGARLVAFVVGRERSRVVDASLRRTAEGRATSPVGYFEGIYVRPECRRR